MNKGGAMIKEVMKLITTQRDSADNSQICSYPLSESESRTRSKEEGDSKAIKLVRKERNLQNRILRLHPQLSSPHVYKLFGFLGINQRALEDTGHEESFFKTYFHNRVVERVEVYENAVLVELSSPQPSSGQLAVAQMIDIYKRKGCMKFYQLATQIEQVLELFGVMEGVQPPAEKPESLKKWLDQLGNSMFICTSGIRKVAISKALLNYLEYDIEEFCIQAVKFRGIYAELFLANSYFSGLMHLLSILKYTIQLANNQISLSEFKELTTFRFSDFILSKSHVKSYCDMSLFLLSPSVLCHKINYIYYKQGEGRHQSGICAIEEEKQHVRQRQYQVIRKIKSIPHSLLTENKQLIAGYKIAREDTEADSIHDSL